jgi:hypothetical protein
MLSSSFLAGTNIETSGAGSGSLLFSRGRFKLRKFKKRLSAKHNNSAAIINWYIILSA